MQAAYDHVGAKILAVRDLTPSVKEFQLRRVDGASLPFIPGEYILYWTGRKYAAFSLASNPLEPETFTIAVAKRGPATAQLHRRTVGDSIPFAGPFGPAFEPRDTQGRSLWFIAGGIGLAGLVAQIRQLEAEPERFGSNHKLFYGLRSRDHALWRDDLERWRQFMDVDLTGDGRHLVGDLLHERLRIPGDVTVLVCGPRPMAHAVFPVLTKLGIESRYILTSIW